MHFIGVLLAMVVAFYPAALMAQAVQVEEGVEAIEKDELPLSPEEQFIFAEEELVTVATKRAIAVREAPANVTVISHDEIMRSPEFSIPEILRRIAGMDVVTPTAAESIVSPRGFANTLVDGDRIAVLVDGRSVLFEPIGGTIFSSLPLSRYDIKRIEVIKGPMSSIHGNRALLGVINIVTYDPDETKTVLGAGGGMFKTGSGDFINAGEFGEGVWYKIAATYERADSFDNYTGTGRNKDLEKIGATGMIDIKPNDKLRARVTAGFSDSDLTLALLGLTDWSLRDGFAMGDFSYDFDKGGVFTMKSWWRRMNFSSSNFLSMGFPSTNFDNVAAELRHTWEYQVRDWLKNTMTYGFEYNFLTTAARGYFPGAEDLHSFAGFIQNEMRLWDKLLFTAGWRVDYQKDFTGLKNSAHGSLVYLAHPRYWVRGSFSTAFSMPSYFRYFYDIRNITGYLPGVNVDILGNKNLNAEKILYADIGNTVLPLDWLKINADIFYYRMTNIIASQLNFTSPTTAQVDLINQGGANAFGGELGVEAEVYKGVNLYANWAYERMRGFSGNSNMASNLGNPRNKVNAGVRYRSNFGFLASLDFHWIEAHQAIAAVIPTTTAGSVAYVDDQFILNAKLSYQPIKDRLEISIIANNILNDNTAQVPVLDPVLNVRLAERPHFRLLGAVSYTF